MQPVPQWIIIAYGEDGDAREPASFEEHAHRVLGMEIRMLNVDDGGPLAEEAGSPRARVVIDEEHNAARPKRLEAELHE